jgi:hypothetical protein
MNLHELAEGYVGMRRTIIGEFYGDMDTQYRKLRALIVDEINPMLVQHGAEPLSLDCVPDPDAED